MRETRNAPRKNRLTRHTILRKNRLTRHTILVLFLPYARIPPSRLAPCCHGSRQAPSSSRCSSVKQPVAGARDTTGKTGDVYAAAEDFRGRGRGLKRGLGGVGIAACCSGRACAWEYGQKVGTSTTRRRQRDTRRASSRGGGGGGGREGGSAEDDLVVVEVHVHVHHVLCHVVCGPRRPRHPPGSAHPPTYAYTRTHARTHTLAGILARTHIYTSTSITSCVVI
jgi:hypothetical protein